MTVQIGGANGLRPALRIPRWRRRLALLRRRATLISVVEIAIVVVALLILVASSAYLSRAESTRLLSPPSVAVLLVANLVPWIGVMVVLARRIARRRANRTGRGAGGRLHVRLVALFSLIAAIPTLLVVVFASLLFQFGVSFWFSDSARTVLSNADHVAQAYVRENRVRIEAQIRPMAGDIRDALENAKRQNAGFDPYFANDDPRFTPYFVQQVIYRSLFQGALIGIGADGNPILIAGANLDQRQNVALLMPKGVLAALDQGAVETAPIGNRMEARIAVSPRQHLYLYGAWQVDPLVITQSNRARRALGDYQQLIEQSRLLQLRFNAALLVVSLLIVAAAIWIAFAVADRLTRPMTDLVDAARRVTLGDLSVRVPAPKRRDEIGVLATAFNRMTRRLQEQTGALVSANGLLDARRALTEAVLRGVSAGVLSVDRDRRVQLINESAEALLATRAETVIGAPLIRVAPEFDALVGAEARDAVVQFASAGELRVLAAKVVGSGDGHVITFDDITQQLLDQRRAAWSDVARRIAHEIKNPLTPIQLAAERLQRRYGKEVQSDPAIFERLTQTIVRQVGDLRRMVDEFSSFARMPKPVFRPEPIADIARQALFLHEVAHPGIAFSLDAPEPSPMLVCDRRLLGQALTNIVKNAVEAIAGKAERGEGDSVAMTIAEADGKLVVAVADSGMGLPADRERLTEPYMTTRVGGTGLGLAIVRKIVEEHFGAMTFADRPGGGSIVRIALDPTTLAPLATTAAEDDDAASEPLEPTRMRAG